MDRLTNGRTVDRRTDSGGRMDQLTNRQTDGRWTDGPANGRTVDRWTDGGQMDGRTAGGRWTD